MRVLEYHLLVGSFKCCTSLLNWRTFKEHGQKISQEFWTASI